jgi:hypothetical protein
VRLDTYILGKYGVKGIVDIEMEKSSWSYRVNASK